VVARHLGQRQRGQPALGIRRLSSLFWGALYQLLLLGVVDRDAVEGSRRPIARGAPGAADRWATAGVVTAIASLTDLRLVQPRLSPGFEHRLSRTGVALVYVGFACGLALAPRRPGQRRPTSR